MPSCWPDRLERVKHALPPTGSCRVFPATKTFRFENDVIEENTFFFFLGQNSVEQILPKHGRKFKSIALVSYDIVARRLHQTSYRYILVKGISSMATFPEFLGFKPKDSMTHICIHACSKGLCWLLSNIKRSSITIPMMDRVAVRVKRKHEIHE